MKALRKALDFKLSELLGLDLLAGLIGGVAGVLLAIYRPNIVVASSGTLATLVTAVIGAVLAGIAIQVAFMDQNFLRRLLVLRRDPVHYLAPFIFTATLGVLAALVLAALAVTPVSAPVVWRAVVSGGSGLLVLYSLASLLPALDTLIQFIGLKSDAAAVPDEVEATRAAASPIRRLPK